MRWPFRRTESPPAEPDDAPAADGAIEAASGADSTDAAGPSSPAWASLPPLQRTIDDRPTLTAPSTELVADVVQRLSPTTTLAPLGHDVGSLAPVGTIGVAGLPLQASGPWPELTGRPAPRPVTVQRSPTGVSPTGVSPPQPSTPVPAEESIEVAGALPPAAPLRTLEAHEPALAPSAPERSLVSAADPLGPPTPARTSTVDLIVARSAAAEAPSQPGVLDALGLGTDDSPATRIVAGPPPARRPGLGAPLVSGALPGLQRIVDPGTSPAAPGAAAMGPGPAEPSGSLPLSRSPARIHVQRLALGDRPMLDPGGIRTDSPADGSGSSGPSPTAASDTGDSAAHRADAPDVAVDVPARSDAAVMVGQVDVSRLASGAPDLPIRSSRALRPLVGGIQPTAVQRQAEETTIEGGTGDEPRGPLPVRSVPAPASIAAGPVVPLVPKPEIAVSRAADSDAVASPPDAAAEDGSGSEPLAAANRLDITGTATSQPLVVARLHAHDAPAIQDPPVTAWSAPRATTAPLARTATSVQRAVDEGHLPATPLALPLARSAPPAATFVSVQASPDAASAVLYAPPVASQNAILSGEADSGSPADGRDDDDPAVIQRATADAAPPAAAPSAPAGGGGAAGGGSEKELDELARRLYDRFRVRLSRELLIDRERAGALTDL